LTGGVIPVSSNGTLDLLERSLSTGSYSEAIFETWSSQLNNSLIALKLGVPIVKSDDVTFAAELATSVIDSRAQDLILGISTTGKSGTDVGIVDTVKGKPASLLFILDAPLTVGNFKLTPEFTTVINRNYNVQEEEGDHEYLVGMSAGYQALPSLGFNLNWAYGTVSNEDSRIGEYGVGGTEANRTGTRKVTNPNGTWSTYNTAYSSNGFILGLGSAIKLGAGNLAIDFKLGTSSNGATKYEVSVPDSITVNQGGVAVLRPNLDANGNQIYVVKSKDFKAEELPTIENSKTDFLFDVRYTWNVHPKFSIQPRWRLYYSSYDDKRNTVFTTPQRVSDAGKTTSILSKMENRPEIILTGSF